MQQDQPEKLGDGEINIEPCNTLIIKSTFEGLIYEVMLPV